VTFLGRIGEDEAVKLLQERLADEDDHGIKELIKVSLAERKEGRNAERPTV
jgi:hypothetical protein